MVRIPGAGRARLAVAGVWAYQGVWAKLLAREPGQRAILAAVPGVGPGRARTATVAIGLAETAMAAWVLSGRAPRACLATQGAAVAAMNAGGLRWAPSAIPHPRRLPARNACFLSLAWLATR